MQTLTLDEIRIWLKSHSIEEHSLPKEICADGSEIRFEIPPTSRGQAHLARFLVHALGDARTALVWIKGWNIWPSEENMVLIDKFRETYGEKRPLIEAPGHEFSRGEKEECIGLLRLCLAFGWDVRIYSDEIGDFITLDHHGLGNLGLNNESKIEEARTFLEEANWTTT